MTLFLTLSIADSDTGPFDLYSDVDGFLSAFAGDVPKASLLAGYSIPDAPDGTTIVRVRSKGVCTNYIDISVEETTTTTTTTSTTLPLVLPVVGDCCSGVTTHYIPYNPAYTIGSVVASNTEGFLGGYSVTGLPLPGIADLVLIDATDYGNCANFLTFFAGSACV